MNVIVEVSDIGVNRRQQMASSVFGGGVDESERARLRLAQKRQAQRELAAQVAERRRIRNEDRRIREAEERLDEERLHRELFELNPKYVPPAQAVAAGFSPPVSPRRGADEYEDDKDGAMHATNNVVRNETLGFDEWVDEQDEENEKEQKQSRRRYDDKHDFEDNESRNGRSRDDRQRGGRVKRRDREQVQDGEQLEDISSDEDDERLGILMRKAARLKANRRGSTRVTRLRHDRQDHNSMQGIHDDDETNDARDRSRKSTSSGAKPRANSRGWRPMKSAVSRTKRVDSRPSKSRPESGTRAQRAEVERMRRAVDKLESDREKLRIKLDKQEQAYKQLKAKAAADRKQALRAPPVSAVASGGRRRRKRTKNLSSSKARKSRNILDGELDVGMGAQRRRAVEPDLDMTPNVSVDVDALDESIMRGQSALVYPQDVGLDAYAKSTRKELKRGKRTVGGTHGGANEDPGVPRQAVDDVMMAQTMRDR